MTADFWLRIPLAALIILAIAFIFEKEELLGWLGDRLMKRIPVYYLKPFFLCVICMASVWGTAVWFATGGTLTLWWPAFCLALCGVMRLISENLLK